MKFTLVFLGALFHCLGLFSQTPKDSIRWGSPEKVLSIRENTCEVHLNVKRDSLPYNGKLSLLINNKREMVVSVNKGLGTLIFRL